MIAPVLAGVAALYGYYRYQKAKEQKALDAALTTPPGFAAPPAPPAGPSARMFQAIGKAVTSQVRANAAPLPQGTYGQGATMADVPPGRIPSSVYGATGPAPASPAPSAGVQVSTGFNFKL